HFRELETTFNEMARTLHDRSQARALDAHRLSEDLKEVAKRVMTPHPDLHVGLDFGTTNSALAVALPDGSVRLATFMQNGAPTSTFRSILYCDPQRRARD